jgi:hypothetical protein
MDVKGFYKKIKQKTPIFPKKWPKGKILQRRRQKIPGSHQLEQISCHI